ncbi:hypothetical protein M011DRAFT_315582 [Sporormia fimetaria CBS 119925]|uniref:Uncharacterized protein n=1 Tax=Sporormia fimetaria CBS 119925 TaxID=1340428 RepID=A0A6A6UWT8_9PLEO|nr:hypothetical protein M011DRAFT_315582 [Sporormia fimetaria CBS 119925]
MGHLPMLSGFVWPSATPHTRTVVTDLVTSVGGLPGSSATSGLLPPSSSISAHSFMTSQTFVAPSVPSIFPPVFIDETTLGITIPSSAKVVPTGLPMDTLSKEVEASLITFTHAPVSSSGPEVDSPTFILPWDIQSTVVSAPGPEISFFGGGCPVHAPCPSWTITYVGGKPSHTATPGSSAILASTTPPIPVFFGNEPPPTALPAATALAVSVPDTFLTTTGIPVADLIRYPQGLLVHLTTPEDYQNRPNSRQIFSSTMSGHMDSSAWPSTPS